jgi:hypothetical protein
LLNPESQEIPQPPFWQIAMPFAGAGHALPQRPQSLTLESVSTHASSHFVKP